MYRNQECYADPTAGEALARITREEQLHAQVKRIREKNTSWRGRIQRSFVQPTIGGIALAIRKTSSVKGEENPWQVLADAIIIQAVKDYRNRARMMKRIRGCLKRNKEMTPSELACQAQRLQQYEEKQDAVGTFFFSRWFSVLSDLDGYDLLDRLQKEVM